MPREMTSYHVVTSFQGPYRFLSNFYPTPVTPVGFDDYSFPSVENAYHALKVIGSDWKFFQRCSPAQARKTGHSMKIRSDWEFVKVQIMEDLLRQKFQNPLMRDLLKATDTALLVEGNDWGDSFWGFDIKKGIGQNILGELLMKVRSEL